MSTETTTKSNLSFEEATEILDEIKNYLEILLSRKDVEEPVVDMVEEMELSISSNPWFKHIPVKEYDEDVITDWNLEFSGYTNVVQIHISWFTEAAIELYDFINKLAKEHDAIVGAFMREYKLILEISRSSEKEFKLKF